MFAQTKTRVHTTCLSRGRDKERVSCVVQLVVVPEVKVNEKVKVKLVAVLIKEDKNRNFNITPTPNNLQASVRPLTEH